MGFLDLFIEREETPKETTNGVPQINKTVPPVVTIPSLVTTTTASTATIAVSADDLQKFNQHFDELFDKANLPGPDYFEFSKMCQAMAQLTEDVKFPAAFGGLQVQGLTKDKLIESANHYIQIIEEDATKFNTAIDQKILSDVQNKRLQAEELRKAIVESQEMIKNLQQEIANKEIEISKFEADAAEQEQKANQKSLTYKAACEARKAMINADIQKINSLIK